MSKSVVLLLVFFLTASCLILVKPAFSSSVAAENSWTQKAPMQVARSGLGVGVVNGRIYAIGGYNAESGVLGINEEYDPETETWTFKRPMPTPRELFAVAVYQNKIYCIGGTPDYSHYSNVNEVYDPATDTWETKTPMPTARLGLQANVVNGKIYLTGGLPKNLNEVYDPANNTWETKAPLPTPTGFVSAVIDNKIYVVGTYSNLSGYIPITQIYDPYTNAWSTGVPPPSTVSGGGLAAAAVTSGEIAPKRMYVFGGLHQTNFPEYFVQIYDPENDTWTFGVDPPTIRDRVAVAVLNDMLYVIGGTALVWSNAWSDPVTTYYATNEQYTPLGYGTVPPTINVASPENVNYTANEVALNFTVNRQVEWMRYSLDGNENVTVTGNITLTGLSIGLHNVTVYAKDEFENTGASETIIFTIAEEPEPFPTTLVAVILVSVAIVGASLLVYYVKFKKQQRKQLPSEQQKG
jgi:N-acetylneuraminic acid mutarotase